MIPTGLRQRVLLVSAGLLLFPWTSPLYGGQGGSGSRRSTGNTPRQPPVSSGSDARNSRGVIITGAVVYEDGAPASLQTRIECVCSARTKRYAAVDSRGFFSLEIAANTRYSTLMPDTSDEPTGSTDVPPNRAGRRFGTPVWVDSMSSVSIMGCELRATLKDFRSNIVNLEGSKSLGQLDVGTIVLYPVAKVTGTLVSVTSLQAPKEAKKALERAEKSLEKKNLVKAESELNHAVQVYPKYAAAWFALGQLHEREQQIQDARDAYRQALAADDNYVKPYVALARLAGIEQHWKEVAEITDRALALHPLDFPEAYYLNSMAYYSLKELDAAERSARKVLRLDPLHRIPAAYLILADILEQKLDIAGSIEQLRSYLRVSPNSPSSDHVRTRIKELEESLRKGV